MNLKLAGQMLIPGIGGVLAAVGGLNLLFDGIASGSAMSVLLGSACVAFALAIAFVLYDAATHHQPDGTRYGTIDVPKDGDDVSKL